MKESLVQLYYEAKNKFSEEDAELVDVAVLLDISQKYEASTFDCPAKYFYETSTIKFFVSEERLTKDSEIDYNTTLTITEFFEMYSLIAWDRKSNSHKTFDFFNKELHDHIQEDVIRSF